MFVARHFVGALRIVACLTGYLVLAFLTQAVAYLINNRYYNGVKQVMALNIEIGGLWCDTQCLDKPFCLQVFLLVTGELVLQMVYLGIHLPTQMDDRRLRVEDVKAPRIDHAVEVRQ